MARQARKKSESGFYHVIVRGMGKQILFEDGEDYNRFLETVKRYRNDHGIQLHAYCLMENHVHMLLRDLGDQLDMFMKKVEGSYAFYYNHKYERMGALFQERYKSEAIDDNAYYAVALRYILQNPEKAGICAADSYPWSSYSVYARERELVHTEFALDYFGGVAQLMKYISEPNDDKCMEPSSGALSDSTAKQMIRDCLNIESGTQLQSYDKAKRDHALRILKESGLSVRQIERLTGISRGIVLKA